MIDPATVERIKGAADIVDVVGDYVHLIRRGANFMGLCPFHNERTPSFSVNRQRNFCYCFSCKKGGSPVNFIMEKEGLSYHEALLHLAKRYGIEVVERELTDEERAKQSLREAMLIANEWAMQQMEEDMTGTQEGRDVGLQYFTERGVTDSAIKAFHLGYAIDRGDNLTDKARKRGFDINVFKQLGLVGTSQSGRDYDRFRGRVIFPIHNPAGKVIAFGGRDLKGGLAKYINSPESEIYKKSNELYGIHQAKSSIVSENKCFLVEGYMDVIGMWQSGMKNVVASSGTALTDGQIAMIHRFTENITLIYDGDAAGIKASLRGIDMLLSHKMNVRVMLLPDGCDPDDFARNHTPEEFRQYVADHETDIIRYKARVMLDTVRNEPHRRIEAINSVVRSIAHIPDQVARDVYVQECAMLLEMPESTIAASVARMRGEVVAALKKERLRKDYPVTQENRTETMPATGHDHPGSMETAAAKVSLHPSDVTTGSSVSPYYKLEEKVLRYCLRYAFLRFCEYEEEAPDGSGKRDIVLDVVEYVDEELRESQMSFSVPLFARIFDLLKEMRPSFQEAYEMCNAEIERKIAHEREEGIDSIRGFADSISSIQKAEKELEERLAKEADESRREFTKDFPVRQLTSHEDDEIRRTATRLALDKYQLSNIFLKEGNTGTEEEKLNVLLVRGIDEWKDQILAERIKTYLEKIKEATAAGDTELQLQLMAELTATQTMRHELSKCIGERIISLRR